MRFVTSKTRRAEMNKGIGVRPVLVDFYLAFQGSPWKKPLVVLTQERKEQLKTRNMYRDQAFAMSLIDGMEWKQAASSVGMEEWMASVLLDSQAFKGLLTRLRENREKEVYGKDPDESTEALAMGNVWTLRSIRDNPQARDADRLRCALILHEMRPSVMAKRSKQTDSGVRVSFNPDIMNRLQEGMRKIKQPTIEVEATPMPNGEGPK
jgi:hypothetical protein